MSLLERFRNLFPKLKLRAVLVDIDLKGANRSILFIRISGCDPYFFSYTVDMLLAIPFHILANNSSPLTGVMSCRIEDERRGTFSAKRFSSTPIMETSQ